MRDSLQFGWRCKPVTWGIALAAFGLLTSPETPPPPPAQSSERPFAWNQDDRWLALEARFRTARAAGCEGLGQSIDTGLSRSRRFLRDAGGRLVGPDDAVLDSLEYNIFAVGSLVAGCLDRLPEYMRFVTRMRSLVKRQSQRWEGSHGKDRLYRLLFGGRAALEEVMLQGPPDAVPSLVIADDEPSETPSTRMLGVTLHSGDILVSRGGDARSALIAVGSDYQGNFSHVALLHVDQQTGVSTVIESNQRLGLRHITLDDYLTEEKLRVMILRVRSDLEPMVVDPMLPHRAAALALDRAKRVHTPYDFAIDYRDDTRMYCSEVPAWAYRQLGVRLWTHLSRISAPGTRKWLTDLGVENFDTLEPSDLEYDPQLRVVAEWRDPEALFMDHVDNVVIEALLDGAAHGDRLLPEWYVLLYARVLKGYSLILNAMGKMGPVPEGLSAGVAARLLTLDRRHAAIKVRVLTLVDEFQRREGYRPPEWQLVKLAKQARDEVR